MPAHWPARCDRSWRRWHPRLAAGDDYGPLGPPDALGLRLPAGFTASLVGVSGQSVAGTPHRWHDAPDGGACFSVPNGDGHVYVSNSEVPDGGGGVSAVEFDVEGRVDRSAERAERDIDELFGRSDTLGHVVEL